MNEETMTDLRCISCGRDYAPREVDEAANSKCPRCGGQLIAERIETDAAIRSASAAMGGVDEEER